MMDLFRFLILVFSTTFVLSGPVTSPRAVPPGCGVFIMENNDLVRMYTFARDDPQSCQPVYDPSDPTAKFVSYQVYPDCTCDFFFDTYSDQPTCQHVEPDWHIVGPVENGWDGLTPTSYTCWTPDA